MTPSRLATTLACVVVVALRSPLAHAQNDAVPLLVDAPVDDAPKAPPPPTPPPTAPLSSETVDSSIEMHRTPVDAMTEHFLGSAARAVRFDWRRSTAAVALYGSELLERNTFGSYRIGATGRKAFGDVMTEVAVTYMRPVATEASNQLALTPYRQNGRPWHVEVDVNAAYPLVEGVVTPLFDFVPPAEVVLMGVGGFRYLFYPLSFAKQKVIDTLPDLAFPALTAEELQGIEPTALPGMLVDRARYHTMAGLMLDVYFQPGFLISPRALIAVPILAPVTQTGLGLWWELSVALGYAF